MAHKIQPPSRPVFFFPSPLLLLLSAAWMAVIFWQTVTHFSWRPDTILLFCSLQRFGAPSMPLVFTQWGSLAKNGLLLLAWLIASQALGRFCLKTFFSFPCSRLDKALYAWGLGFAVFSLLLIVLSALQCLYAPLVIGLLLLGASWGAWQLWQDRQQLKPAPGWLLGRMTVTDRALLLLVVFFVGLAGVLACTPEIFYDSLVYHLAVPSTWIRAHGFQYLPYTFYSNFPMALEILYTGMLLMADERLCRLLHVVLGVLAGLAIFAAGRRWFGRRTGFWAMGIFLTTPVVVMSMHACGVDTGTAFFAFLAVMPLMEWALSREKQSSQLRLAGVLIGMAMACKYNAAFMLAPAVAAAFVTRYIKTRSWKNLGAASAILALAGLLFVLPWLVKSAVYTGNPVYPFLYKIIPSKNIHPAKMEAEMVCFKEYGQRTFLEFLREPWDMSLYMPTSNSFIGTVYLLLLPGILLIAVFWKRGPPVLRWLFAVTAFATVIWARETQTMRYYIQILPLAALLSAFVLMQAEHLNRWLGLSVRTAVVLLMFWCLGETTVLVLSNMDPLGVFLGLESRNAYLDRELMDSYTAMARVVNQLPGKVRVLLVGETRSYYYQQPLTVSTVYDRDPFVETLAQAPSAEAIWRQWRAQGYTHLCEHQQEAVRIRSFEPYVWDAGALNRLRLLKAHYLRPVAKIGQTTLYEIVAEPLFDQPEKLGRPLYTYDSDVIEKIKVHFNILAQAQRAGQNEDVRAAWMRMIALAPEWATPYVELAWFYLRNGKKDEAFQAFQTADRLDWLEPNVYNNLGVLCLEHGAAAPARHYFQLALEGDPHMETARKNLEWLGEMQKAGKQQEPK